MLEKYYKILNIKKEEKEKIKEFIEKEIKIKDFEVIINDKKVKIKTNSSNRFVLDLNKNKIESFIKEMKLFYT